jgi:hypothetical protein
VEHGQLGGGGEFRQGACLTLGSTILKRIHDSLTSHPVSDGGTNYERSARPQRQTRRFNVSITLDGRDPQWRLTFDDFPRVAGLVNVGVRETFTNWETLGATERCSCIQWERGPGLMPSPPFTPPAAPPTAPPNVVGPSRRPPDPRKEPGRRRRWPFRSRPPCSRHAGGHGRDGACRHG